MKIAFFTDIHLNFLSKENLDLFCKTANETKSDAIVISGDIAESQNIEYYLDYLDQNIDIRKYFVLGNHDFYNGSITETRKKVGAKYSTINSKTVYLTTAGFVPITERTAIVGHDGWYDGGYANWFNSRLDMTDYHIIKEISDKTCEISSWQEGRPVKEIQFSKIQELAKESALHVIEQTMKAFEAGFENVIVATHVPPFPELSTYRGKMSDDTWLPHFSSKHMGVALLELANNNKNKTIMVLCGHSHGKAYYKPLPNLSGFCGEAEYGRITISNLIEIK